MHHLLLASNQCCGLWTVYCLFYFLFLAFHLMFHLSVNTGSIIIKKSNHMSAHTLVCCINMTSSRIFLPHVLFMFTVYCENVEGMKKWQHLQNKYNYIFYCKICLRKRRRDLTCTKQRRLICRILFNLRLTILGREWNQSLLCKIHQTFNCRLNQILECSLTTVTMRMLTYKCWHGS